MKAYRLFLSKNTLPIYFLPIKFVDDNKVKCGFLLYNFNKKGISKDFILNRYHGILALPEVDKNQKDVDASIVNTAEDLFELFITNFDVAGLNSEIRDTAIDLGFDLTEEEKARIIATLDIQEEGKQENTVFLE